MKQVCSLIYHITEKEQKEPKAKPLSRGDLICKSWSVKAALTEDDRLR